MRTSVATPIVHSTAPRANEIAQPRFDLATRDLRRSPVRELQFTLRDAAYMIGVGRVAEASRLRGWV